MNCRVASIRFVLIALQIVLATSAIAQTTSDNPNELVVARLKYYGGDWYWGNSALPNLITYLKQNTSIPVATDEVRVSLEDDRIFNYPFIFLTGHGGLKFSEDEAQRLNRYLTSGGFLFANDSYGLKDSFLDAMKLVFPDAKPVELPFDYGIFSCYYTFANGLPKIHKHDGKPPQAFGWFSDGRLVILFVYESDIGDGWEDPQVHNDPPDIREQALKMGVNIIVWALTN